MKKTIPLVILQAIEPFLEKLDKNILGVDRSGNSIFRVEDIDSQSDFYFRIIKHEPGQQGLVITVEYKPSDPDSTVARSNKIYISSFAGEFKKWLSLLDSYNAVKTPYDDPILERYEEEFFAEFETADEDADEVSFSLKKQLLIDKALDNLVALLEVKKDEVNKETVTALIGEIEEIRETLTESTKTEIVSRISKLFAKIRKLSIKMIKDAYPILQKEIITQAVKGGFELVTGIDVTTIIDGI